MRIEHKMVVLALAVIVSSGVVLVQSSQEESPPADDTLADNLDNVNMADRMVDFTHG